MVWRILDLEGHQDCMISSKVATILTTYVCPWLVFVEGEK